MPTGSHDSAVGSARAQIARDVLRVHRDSYGTRGGDVVVHVTEDSVFVVIDRLELSEMEKSLVSSGHPEAVRALREEYERTIEPTFRALVERATGRQVTGFLSTVSTSPPCAVEVFRLAV